VFDYYHEKGFWQALAKHPVFENTTLGVIAFNAVWIAVDTDHNKADSLLSAHIVFIIAENAFCTYFTGEWIIRFMAFKYKRNGLHDAWFVFDSILVFMMVMETWIITLVFALVGTGVTGLRNASILRILRLARMVRISRLARLMRAIPELVILLKGIGAASRSVFVFFLLWVIIIYVFAVGVAVVA